MQKTGNQHSDFLSQFAEIAKNTKTAAKKETKSFADIINFPAPKQPTLREIFQKAAQFNDMPEETPDMGSDLGAEPMGEMGDMGEGEQVAEDTEGAKSHLANALIALCGGIEEAKACLDASGEPTAGEIPEGGMMEGDTPPQEMPAPMEMSPSAPSPMPMAPSPTM